MMSTLTGTSIESPLESVTRTKNESPSGGALTGTSITEKYPVELTRAHAGAPTSA